MTMNPQKMMGLQAPDDQRVPVPVRDWQALKLALWRSRTSWTIAERAAREILRQCRHTDGCPGATDFETPCTGHPTFSEDQTGDARLSVEAGACPDRELRASALVILGAARQFAPIDASRPAAAPYFAPSREYYSEIMAELATAEAELVALRGDTATPAPPKHNP